MKVLKRKLLAIVMAVVIALSVVTPSVGMKQVEAATPMQVSIHVPRPIKGKVPDNPSDRNLYYIAGTSGPSGCVNIADFSDSIFEHGIYWTDNSNNKMSSSSKFSFGEYYLHVLLEMNDSSSVSGSYSLSNNVEDYKIFWRGHEAKDICDQYPLYYITDVKDYSYGYKAVTIKMSSQVGWNYMRLDIEEPEAGEQVLKKVTWNSYKEFKPKDTFNNTTVEFIDISDTWYESTDGVNYKKMNSNDKYVKGRYYKTSAPKKIMNYLLEHFYDGDKCPYYNTNFGYGFGTTTDIAYGLDPEFTFEIHGNQFSGFDPNNWNKTGVMQNGEYIFSPAREKISEIKISNLSLPIAGNKPDTYAQVDGDGYSMKKISADTTDNVEWFDKNDGNRKLSWNEKFVAGHTYVAHFTVTANDTYFFKGKYNTIINGYDLGETLNTSSNSMREVEFSAFCPDMALDEDLTISGVEPVFTYDDGIGGRPFQNTNEWILSGKYVDKYALNFNAEYYYIDDDGKEKKVSSDYDIKVGKKYQMRATLKSKSGYPIFPDTQELCEKIKVKVEGAEKTSVKANGSGYSIQIIAEYTAKRPINELSISGQLQPVAGKTNEYKGFSSSDKTKYDLSTMSSDYYKNGILWGTVNEDGTHKSVKVDKPITFEKGKKYFVEFLVQAKDGEKFVQDITKIKATVGGVEAKVSEPEGGKNCVLVTIEAEAKEAITNIDCIVLTPVVGEKPGDVKLNTVPKNALKKDVSFNMSWEVSKDGKTYESMDKDAVYEAGKYYRISEFGLKLFVVLSCAATGVNEEVTYGVSSNYTLTINGKSIKDAGFVDGYLVYGPLIEKKSESPNDDTKKDDKKQDSTSTKPGDKTTTSPNKTDGKTVDGVGTISKDGKTLTDPDGVKYKVSDKITTAQLKKNTKIADKKSGGKYRITKITKKNGKVVGGTVEYMAPYNKNAKLISATGKVKLAGVTFTVTSLAQNCGKGCKNLTKVVVGENVTNIGKNAFSGCSKLKTINIKTKKLKKVGANAFKGINKKATISVPKAKKKAYTKLLKGKGQAKTVKIK